VLPAPDWPRPERLHRLFQSLIAPFSSSTRGCWHLPAPVGFRTRARPIVAMTHQYRSGAVSDERNDPNRHRSRHCFPGKRRSDLWYKLARPSMSLSGAVFSPGMALHGNRAFGRRLHRLETAPKPSLEHAMSFKKRKTAHIVIKTKI